MNTSSPVHLQIAFRDSSAAVWEAQYIRMADSNRDTKDSAPETRPFQEQITSPKANSSTAAPPLSSSVGVATSRPSSPSVGDGAISSPGPSSTRAPYSPQFSAATQMILKRMRGEKTGGLSSALASVTAPGAPRPFFPQATYESVRQRLAASMSSDKSANVSAPSPSPTTTSATLPLPISSSPRRSTAATLALTGQKRKRGKEGIESDVSSPAEASDYGEGIKRTTPKPNASSTPTTTKSGRHILKPDTYDPAAEDNAKKRNRLGTRTTEQALCKKCTRMHSPATNQMVFCDGCNDPWHQRCHEPWIEDEVVRDQNLNWYCLVCAAKRERLQPKKKVVAEQPRWGSWAGKSAGQVRCNIQLQCRCGGGRKTNNTCTAETSLPLGPPSNRPRQPAHLRHRAAPRPPHLPRRIHPKDSNNNGGAAISLCGYLHRRPL